MNIEVIVPQTDNEIDKMHEYREYVLRESFRDDGIELGGYDREAALNDPTSTSLIMKVDGETIGSVRMDKVFRHLKFKAHEARIALFAIDPNLQSNGHGSKFFAGVKKWCESNNITTIYNNSRHSSHKFWSKMGFVDELWDSELNCETEIQMVLRL